MLNKKANLIENWGDIVTISILIIGFILSYFSKNEYFTYAIIFLIGFAFGRLFYYSKNMPKSLVPRIIIIFFIGFLLGSLNLSKTLLFTFFITGTTISFLLYYKKIIS